MSRRTRARGAPAQHRTAVPVLRVSARSFVSPREHSRVSAVPRTAVRALAGEQHRARRPRVCARRHPCALRGAACHGRVSCPPDPRERRGRSCPEGRDHAARHRHHAGRKRSVVFRDRRLLDRAVRRGDGGLRESASRHVSSPQGQARDPGDPELPRLSPLPASGVAGAPGPLLPRRRESGPAHVELPSGQAGRGGGRSVRHDRGAGPRPAAAGRRRAGSREGPRPRSQPRGRRSRRGAGGAGSGRAAAVDQPICSCCPRCRKASAWRRSRRWPAGCRSWHRASAG